MTVLLADWLSVEDADVDVDVDVVELALVLELSLLALVPSMGGGGGKDVLLVSLLVESVLVALGDDASSRDSNACRSCAICDSELVESVLVEVLESAEAVSALLVLLLLVLLSLVLVLDVLDCNCTSRACNSAASCWNGSVLPEAVVLVLLVPVSVPVLVLVWSVLLVETLNSEARSRLLVLQGSEPMLLMDMVCLLWLRPLSARNQKAQGTCQQERRGFRRFRRCGARQTLPCCGRACRAATA